MINKKKTKTTNTGLPNSSTRVHPITPEISAVGGIRQLGLTVVTSSAARPALSESRKIPSKVWLKTFRAANAIHLYKLKCMRFVSSYFVTFQQRKQTHELLLCTCTRAFNQRVRDTLQIDFVETWAPNVLQPGSTWVSAHSQPSPNQIKLGVTVWFLQINLHCQSHLPAALSGRMVYKRVKQTPRLKWLET